MPTGKDEESKVHFCIGGEDGELHLVGEVTNIDSLDKETYGTDMSDVGFYLPDKSLSFSFEASFSKEVMFEIMGVNVVNIVYCKDCMHRNSDGLCPLTKFDAVDDYDFCSRGVKKWK